MLALVLALVAASPVSPAGQAHARAEAIARGDRAFAERDAPARLAEAIEVWSGAAATGATDPQLELRLARAQAFRALAEPASAAAAWAACSRSAERALRALSAPWTRAVESGDLVGAPAAVGPEGAEALHWLALATWNGAAQKGPAAILAVKDAALAAMERAAALDGSTDCGGPHRALGAWKAALPAGIGGGVARSRRHFEQARALGPGCLLTPVAEARSLLVLLQDRAAFDRTLAEVERAGDADPRWAPENALARRDARLLRADASRLF